MEGTNNGENGAIPGVVVEENVAAAGEIQQ